MATMAKPTIQEADAVTQRGADLVWRALETAGANIVFGYPGGACLPMYDALPDHPGVHHVLVRHEQGAAHMCAGYARATGRVGVCVATSGPGATNLVTGLACAYMDSVPVVAITGQVSTPLMGRDAFQETDVLGMVGPVTKHSILVQSVGDIEPAIHRAFAIARGGRPGPVLVDIPKDIQLHTMATRGATNDARALPVPGADAAELDRAAALLAGASRPVIIAGQGVRLGRAHAELRKLAERIDAPVVTTLLGIGAISEEHPLAAGMLGMHGSARANRMVNDADVILGVGLRFDDRVTGKIAAFAPNAKIIHADIDATQIGKNVPAAIGAQMGRPSSEVWAIAGDGGAQMTIHELGTAVQESAPVKLAIMNNGYLGMVRQWQQLFHDGRISQTPISSPDYVKLADAYGVLGMCVERRTDLGPALARAKAHPGPVVMDIRIEREANVWPIVPPGGANADLIEEPAS